VSLTATSTFAPAFRNQKGFTLLEVLIVISILASLTIMTAQSIQKATNSKVKLDMQTQDVGQLRDALKIMQRDIQLAFHYRDLNEEFNKIVRENRKKALSPNSAAPQTPNPSNPSESQQPPPPPAPPNPSNPTAAPTYQFDANNCLLPIETDPLCKKNPNRKDSETHFVGKNEELYFVTQNVGRISENPPTADFQKVGYFVKPCKRITTDNQTQETSINCLMRRNSSIVEGDVTKGGEEAVLIEDVTSFKLRYLGIGKQDWISDWSSRDGEFKGKFPEAVEIEIAIEKELKVQGKIENEEAKKKKISMILAVPVRFTNNTTDKTSNSNTNTNTITQ
jgi:prepilin-type N-terminal cleavage/methylation domain-containing protein